MKVLGMLVVAIISIFAFENLCLAQKVGSEEYKVFSTVLREIYKENRKEEYANKSPFVILDHTEFDADDLVFQSGSFPRLERSIRDRNTRPARLEKRLSHGKYSKTYYLASRADVAALLEEGKKKFDEAEAMRTIKTGYLCSPYWDVFYTKYPDTQGFFTLSRVGFTRRHAMVHVNSLGSCGGSRRTYVLKKTKRGWRIYTAAGQLWVA